MEVRRTVPVKPDVPDKRRDDLHETVDQFLHCANRTSDFAWHSTDRDECITSKAKAERALYDSLRDETDLTANLVQKGVRRAVEAIKSGVDRWAKRKRTSQPFFDAPSVVYDKRSATFHRDHASLSTVNGRVECEYVLPSNSERETPHAKYLSDEDFEFRTSTLQYRERTDEFYLHVGLRRYDGDDGVSETTENGTVLGVDLNVDGYLAVTSTGLFGESADYINHRRRQFEQVRGDLQRTGTESAHDTFHRLGSREWRWVEDLLHRESKALVAEAVEHGCSTIAFENLTDIRDRMANAKKFHAWTFRRLFEYVEYKAEERGLLVVQVNPAYTSQRCSRCGTTLSENRDGDSFSCRKCGYELHADYNAAKNIAHRHVNVHPGPKSRDGRATRQLALKSGTLSANASFEPAEPASDGTTAEAGVHRQAHESTRG
jgi:IS605 OrfB family transposase